MMKKKALVILSGGQDSTYCLYWAKQHFDEVYAVTFDYGQRHRIEIDAAKKVAQMAGVKEHEVIDVKGCLVSVSPLLSDNDLEQYKDAKQMDEIIGNRIELTFVPMRNTFFFTVAMNRAVKWGCTEIVTGICEMDEANYPDCREDFMKSFEKMVNLSLGCNDYTFHAPLLSVTKNESVILAYAMPNCWEAMAYTHTSYAGEYPPIDKNHANVLRAKGFEEAGLPDPLVVRAWKEGLMSLPDTSNYNVLKSIVKEDIS